MTRHRELSAAVAGLFLFLAIAARASTCPPILIDGQPYDADSVVVANVAGSDTLHLAGFDFHHGQFFGYDKNVGGSFEVSGTDLYTLEGPPPGTHVQLDLGVLGSFSNEEVGGFEPNCACATHSAHILLTIQNSFGDVDSFHTCVCGTIGLNMSRYLDVIVGQEFSVQYRMVGTDSTAGTYVEGRASIQIQGLTPDIQIISCHGILRSVPTLPQSWGAIKARYR